MTFHISQKSCVCPVLLHSLFRSAERVTAPWPGLGDYRKSLGARGCALGLPSRLLHLLDMSGVWGGKRMVKELGYPQRVTSHQAGWHRVVPRRHRAGARPFDLIPTDAAAASFLRSSALPKCLEDPQAPAAHPRCCWQGARPLASGTPNFSILRWPFMPWGGRSIWGRASAPSQTSDLACIVPWQSLYFFSCFPVFFAIGLFCWVMAIAGVIWGVLSVPLSKQLAAWCPDPVPRGGLPCHAPHISDGSDPPWPRHRGKNISPGIGRDHSALCTLKSP